MSTEHRFLVLHADDDLDEIHDLLVHLAPLSRLGGIDLVAARDLEDASHEAMGELFGDARAVLVCLSAATLALDPILDDDLRALAPQCRIELVLLRDCAHQLVPWLAVSETVPADGRLLSDLPRAERDAELSRLAYRLAGTIDVVADAGLDEDEEIHDSTPDPAPQRGPGALLEPAAGPGPQTPFEPAASGTGDDEVGADRFAATLAEVLPVDQPVDDEALAALVELALHLAAARVEFGDEAAAVAVLRDAADRLVANIGSEQRKGSRVGRRARTTKRLLEEALGTESEDALETMRAAFEQALDQGAPVGR